MTHTRENISRTPAEDVLTAAWFAFKVVTEEYERLKVILADLDTTMSDEVLLELTTVLYNRALEEYETPLQDCCACGVIATKYKLMSDVDREAYEESIMGCVKEKEKKSQAMKKAAGGDVDYEKCFGGSAADAKNEAEAAKILRGDATASSSNEIKDSEFPLLDRSKIIYTHSLQEKSLRSVGRWRRFLGLGATKDKDCWMYINVLTREVVSIRPSEYEEEVKEVAAVEELEAVNSGSSGDSGRWKSWTKWNKRKNVEYVEEVEEAESVQ